MERRVFGRKTLECHRPRVDRFVLPRDVSSEMRWRRSRSNNYAQKTVDIWDAKQQQQIKYRNYLDEAFGYTRNSDEVTVQHWPCIPRKKPYLSSADSILDLPTYANSAFSEVLDWGSSNLLVAALRRNFYMFSWPAQMVTSMDTTKFNIQCCKFDPIGELLLLGTDQKSVEIRYACVCDLLNGVAYCKCGGGGAGASAGCAIMAVDWSPTGNSFVAGCCQGTVNCFDRDGKLLFSSNLDRGPIRSLKVSPDARYLALATFNSDLVHILTWPSLEYYNALTAYCIVKSIAWHPWRSALLGIGAVSSKQYTTIEFWDTPSSRCRDGGFSHSPHILDVMLFSHRTGELVLSLWNKETTSLETTQSHLVVMSDLNTVVDHSGDVRNGLDRIRTILFSPDGTKLATATEDEDLIIWNFLPEDNKKKPPKTKRFSAIPVYLDHTSNGFVLR